MVEFIKDNRKLYDIETMKQVLKVPKSKIQRELKKIDGEIIKYKNLFLKYLLEKYESQELPDEETNVSNRKLEDEFDEIINGQEVKKDEVQDEIEKDEDDDNIDNLVKEYQLLEKKYKLKSNGRIYKR